MGCFSVASCVMSIIQNNLICKLLRLFWVHWCKFKLLCLYLIRDSAESFRKKSALEWHKVSACRRVGIFCFTLFAQ